MDIETEYASGPQHVGFRKTQDVLLVQREPAPRYEDKRDEHGQAHEEQRKRALLDSNGREFKILARSGISLDTHITSAHLELSLA
jgi:hypothetical protein